MLAPIIHYGSPGDAVVGIIILRIDPDQLLYPLIRQWPVPSQTAETYLVRREGREVMYLTDLKRRKETALKFKLPLDRDELPEVMAIQGREGSVTGLDYAGKKVYANIHAIPNSPWFIIAKMDMAEANSSAYAHVWLIGIIVLAMIIAAGGIIGLLSNRQQKKYLHQQLELSRERQALSRHYEYLTKNANDIILLLDDKLNIIEANERALNTYGYSDRLLEMSIYNLRASEPGLSIEDQYRKVVDENGLVFECIHKKNDGTNFPVEVSARMIDIEGQKYFQTIIRDISERKRTQEILQLQKNELESANQELLITNRKLESSREELKAAAVRWESTFDAIGDGLSILDNDFTILQCNIQFSSLVKKSFKQIIGKKCHQIIHGSPEPLPDCPVAKMKNSEKRESSEFENGGRWFKIVADPIFNSRQQMVGAVHILSDITEWKRAEEKINASLKEKEVLLREIHHRVKNNLQIISSLLNLQSGYIQDQRALDLFKECQTRVRSMSLIHERLYQSESLSNIKFSEYVKILIDDLFHSYGVDTNNVSYSLDVIDQPIKIDTAIPCGLIVNELISNSLKYAFPGQHLLKKKGKINIKLAQEDAGKFILEIADNGIGLPKGFDLRKAETLGLQLVATLVEQLDGKIEIKGNKGAVFTIRFEER